MTDNEKAATFIKWAPDKYDHVHHFWRDKDGCRVPDMRDPRNYMKALLATSGFIIDFASELGGFPWWSVEIWRDSDRIALGESRESMADAAIKGLAALWDAERPE